ncbi:CRE-AARS-1 protein [Caenorhabditis remanei]|uniref:Alanine--tRNA ligase n=1 Tax=Caenorhabditis remanei TaxID=31234 RepID=E3LF90_CAERE|nr:CRE-AARS-1 protein [Caenorhabditis remanei]
MCQMYCVVRWEVSRELRKSFFEFFKSKNHEILKSASVIPAENDSSLLFTNAGMNQFKPLILSSSEPKRVANIQKCIRAGGKHNDLDDVGKDLHHQTFFEMMGNWSFNDAFSKQEACQFAWDYLVKTLSIDSDRLYVSYFGGIERLGLPEDRECREIWKRIGIPSDRILPFVAENFWEMGSAGPCGPCTEIHYDRIGGRNASSLVNIDDSVVEIWNIVFMSNIRDSSGHIHNLGKNHIDTGMGFERLLSVVQNRNSNFDTDAFTPILDKITSLTKNKLKYNGTLSSREDAVFRLVADHVRAATVAISDGAIPDGTGSGFIVRKMMRRSFLQGNSKLGIERFGLSDLVPVVISTMVPFLVRITSDKEVYPEIEKSSNEIIKTFKDEETQFWKTVDKAKKMFDGVANENKSPVISGRKAFNLFETHGLPLSVTVEMARNIGKEVDEKEFERCQLEAQKLSQKASQLKLPVSASDFPTHTDNDKYSYTYKNGRYGKSISFTLTNFNYLFLEFPKVQTRILEVYKNQEKANCLNENEKGFVVLENCQFYGEQGGQTSDTGKLLIDKKEIFEVESAKKLENGAVTVLFGRALQPIQRDLRVEQQLDEKKREGVMKAHSATHLLNWALQKSGLGCGQKGSSVDCNRLRFDYSTKDDVMEKEQRSEVLKQGEERMNEFIRHGGETIILETTIEEAKKIENLQSDVKEDRIGNSTVRVVSLGIGRDVPVECCSGTHVHDVKVIEDIAIMSDKSMGQRLRRIIAVTGEEAQKCREYAETSYKDLKSKEPKERSKIAKKIDWKRVPLVDQSRISALLKQKR